MDLQNEALLENVLELRRTTKVLPSRRLTVSIGCWSGSPWCKRLFGMKPKHARSGKQNQSRL